ncbi:MAG: hypothetical protein VX554_00110, partial [Candidatus Thermoplasmatota archaeon]|nr:hypothetical protein [Candidatus Thermoplasmatota archaeon]
ALVLGSELCGGDLLVGPGLAYLLLVGWLHLRLIEFYLIVIATVAGGRAINSIITAVTVPVIESLWQ